MATASRRRVHTGTYRLIVTPQGMLWRLGHVVGEPHPEEVVHVRAERLFNAQRHFRRRRSLAVQQV